MGLSVAVETGAGIAATITDAVCTMNTLADPSLVADLAAAGIDGVAMEMVPRITCAQSMDVLSSQTNLAGYRAVIEGAGAFARLSDDDDGRRHRAARSRIGGRRRSGQIAGDCDRARLSGIVSGTDVRPAAKRKSSLWAPLMSASRTRRPRNKPALMSATCRMRSGPSRRN